MKIGGKYWYSILINNQALEFFHSIGGLNMESIFSILFILVAEVLIRTLNTIFDDGMYIGYEYLSVTIPPVIMDKSMMKEIG